MSTEDNQQQPQQQENGTSNNVDVPEIELIIKVTRQWPSSPDTTVSGTSEFCVCDAGVYPAPRYSPFVLWNFALH